MYLVSSVGFGTGVLLGADVVAEGVVYIDSEGAFVCAGVSADPVETYPEEVLFSSGSESSVSSVFSSVVSTVSDTAFVVPLILGDGVAVAVTEGEIVVSATSVSVIVVVTVAPVGTSTDSSVSHAVKINAQAINALITVLYLFIVIVSL
jgi:hypothetical protein